MLLLVTHCTAMLSSTVRMYLSWKFYPAVGSVSASKYRDSVYALLVLRSGFQGKFLCGLEA